MAEQTYIKILDPVNYSMTSSKARLRQAFLLWRNDDGMPAPAANASMLCDSALVSAGQYADICDVMFAWHVSIQRGALSRLYH